MTGKSTSCCGPSLVCAAASGGSEPCGKTPRAALTFSPRSWFDQASATTRQGNASPKRRLRRPRRAPYTNWIGLWRLDVNSVVFEFVWLVGMEFRPQNDADHMSDLNASAILILNSLAQDTPLILLDEPTASRLRQTVTNWR